MCVGGGRGVCGGGVCVCVKKEIQAIFHPTGHLVKRPNSERTIPCSSPR